MNTYSFSLSGMDIDAASERLSAFLESIGVEHLNVLRISLSIEELLAGATSSVRRRRSR